MCKPPGPSVTTSQPPEASEDIESLKVEGEIEEQQLRYEVSLYRQEDEKDGDDVRGVVR